MPALANAPAGWTYIQDSADGNPIYQLIDSAGTIKEWEVDSTTGAIIWHINALQFGVADDILASQVPEGWTLVGYDSAGYPVFQLIDGAGNIKEWAWVPSTGAIIWHQNATTFGVPDNLLPAAAATSGTTNGSDSTSGGTTGSDGTSGGTTNGSATTGSGTTGGATAATGGGFSTTPAAAATSTSPVLILAALIAGYFLLAD